jgi:pyruvate,water dikinase
MIRWLDSLSRADLPEVGGKAAHLGELLAAGMPVPVGFVVGTNVYQAYVDGIPALAEAVVESEGYTPAAVEHVMRSLWLQPPMPQAIETAVVEAYRALGEKMGAADVPVAVRSSAIGEDSEAASFAGQQVTYLNCRGEEEVVMGMRACWAGLWSERAIAYRRRMVGGPPPTIAVLIQALLRPEVAGVAFTVNPVSGDRDEVVIDASWGLGEAVVSGRATPDHIRVDKRDGSLRHYAVGTKEVEVVPDKRGVTERPVPDARRKRKALTPEQLSGLRQLALAAETRLDGPQDLEWAIAQGKLYLLQSRPITAIAPPPPPGGWVSPIPGARWERRNFAEHFSAPLSPLAASLVLPAVAQSLGPLAREVGFELPSPGLIALHGYAYARGDMRKRWDLPARAAHNVFELLFRGPAQWERAKGGGHAARMGRLLASVPGHQDEPGLIRWCESFMAEFAATWADVHRLSGGWRWSEYAVRMALGGHMQLAGALLSGYGGPAIALEAQVHALATEADKAIGEAIDGASPWEALLALGPAAAEYRTRIQTFCRAGNALPASFDPAMPLPFESEDAACRLIAQSRSQGGEGPTARLASLTEERRALVASTLAEAPLPRRLLLQRLLPWAQAYAEAREPALASLGLGWQTFREVLLTLGALWTSQGKLDEPSAVFLLSWDELKSGLAPSRPALAERLALWQRQAGYNPPLMIGGEPERFYMKAITGVPASPGRVTGICRVILGPETFDTLQPGEILIAPATTPAWTPLFHLAGAIVTDVGGPLSHGSIVAREFRIPAVLGTESATRRLKSGMVVTVDGDLGLIWEG